MNNDLIVNAECLFIRNTARHLSELQCDGNNMDLWRALDEIGRAVERAQFRLNDLAFGKNYKPPLEQMGT